MADVGKTRAGAGAGLTREGRARWRWLACPRGGGKTRPDSPAHRQPEAWPGPREGRGGDEGQPPPTASQPEPRPGPTSPLPAAPSAAPLRTRPLGPRLVRFPERGRRPQSALRLPRSSSCLRGPSLFPEQLRKRLVQSITSLILAVFS